MIKEHPILFSDRMVRAILDGRKTQARRAVKLTIERGEWEASTIGWDGVKNSDGTQAEVMACIWNTTTGKTLICPHGKPGDRLWVRETWSKAKSPYLSSELFYRADGESNGKQFALSFIERESRWRSPIHMPRLASRILLEVTDIRVERLNDISEKDAIAEGAEVDTSFPKVMRRSTISRFEGLWESINGQGSWDLNPWVWVVEFKVILK